MNDLIIRALSATKGLRALICAIPASTRQICSLHNTSETVSVAVGRALAGGALMGALLKPGQRLALKFEGNGPLGKLIVEADYDGAIRAGVANPAAEVPPLNGRWNIPGLLGRAGFLTVSKDLGLGGQPYSGMVQLRTSEIGDDLAFYLTDSEQTPSAVGVSAVLDASGLITECGGFLIQALPQADETELETVMANISSLPPLATILRDHGPEKLLELLFAAVPFTRLETRDVFFRCGCSREKVERALLSLGKETLHDMIVKEQGADVTCEFCRQAYHFDGAELTALADGS